MSIRNAILFIGIITVLAACNINRSEDAMKLCTQVTAINDSLMYLGKQWNDELKIAAGNKDFSQLPTIRGNMKDFIERKIIDLNTMHDVGGSEPFREAQLELLLFDRDTVLPHFVMFESFEPNTPDIEIEEAYRSLFNTLRNEKGKLDKVYTLRDKYADDNDFPRPIDR